MGERRERRKRNHEESGSFQRFSKERFISRKKPEGGRRRARLRFLCQVLKETLAAAVVAAAVVIPAKAVAAAAAAAQDQENDDNPGASATKVVAHIVLPPFELHYSVWQRGKSCYKGSGLFFAGIFRGGSLPKGIRCAPGPEAAAGLVSHT